MKKILSIFSVLLLLLGLHFSASVLTAQTLDDPVAVESNAADTDGDGISNAAEGESLTDEPSVDSDGDSVPDYIEPNNVDTDGDGATNNVDVNDDGDGMATV